MKRALVALGLIVSCACARSSSDSKVEHWVIVGHSAPGVSAMSDADAARWLGRSIDLGPDLAVAGPDSCTRPLYRKGLAPGDSVADAYHIAPGSLGASWPPGANLTIVETSCDGEPWYSPGALLIKTSDKHAFSPWEGVFFELEKR